MKIVLSLVANDLKASHLLPVPPLGFARQCKTSAQHVPVLFYPFSRPLHLSRRRPAPMRSLPLGHEKQRLPADEDAAGKAAEGGGEEEEIAAQQKPPPLPQERGSRLPAGEGGEGGEERANFGLSFRSAP